MCCMYSNSPHVHCSLLCSRTSSLPSFLVGFSYFCLALLLLFLLPFVSFVMPLPHLLYRIYLLELNGGIIYMCSLACMVG